MRQAVTAILYAPGTNCHEETGAAIELAGGKSEVVLLHDLMEGRRGLGDYQAAVIPGGFSYGDHLGAGRIYGTLLVAKLRQQLVKFLEAKKPLLGICNGFQVLAEAGILPGRSPGKRGLALLENQSARFEDRKIRLVVSAEKTLWTESLQGEVLAMPTAHGEGRPLFCETSSAQSPRVAFRFADGAGNPTTRYPENPNGAPGSVAGITDATGMVLGLMPHPERASLPAHYSQDGLKLFLNLVQWLRRS
ncbi:MAG TPA: phosphoribosylformylglycinamidine synthase I [Terriglobia bacterium]|nr:phosphoribosylformylglycinamidine synthase I [Terriglobia bacterium]